MSQEQRYASANRSYQGNGIEVQWEPGLCIHSMNCVHGQPGVFDPNARPWIKAEAASADDLAATIATCPTSALRFHRTDAGRQETPPSDATIEAQRNGPLYLRGDLEVVDQEGNVVRKAMRLALCRCGASGNKPYCDLSHETAGFKA